MSLEGAWEKKRGEVPSRADEAEEGGGISRPLGGEAPIRAFLTGV